MAGNSIDVYVKLSMGRNVQYDLHPNDGISTVIELVAKDEGVAINQVRLKYQGKILVTTKTIREYGVRAETILKSMVLVPKDLSLSIHWPDGNAETMTMCNLETANRLMEVICDKCEATEELLDVECNGQKLKSSTSKLLELGIEDRAEITVKIKDDEQLLKEEEEERAKKKKTSCPAKETMDKQAKESLLSSFQTHGKRVEVVFSFDTTGSMYSYLEQVRNKLRECCTRLIQDIPNIRIGLIAHGDYCDQDESYVLRSLDLTNDVDELTQFARDVSSTSGGDSPECYEWVLRKAQHLDWAEDSAKALVVIGDCYPHPPSYTDQNIRWRDELDMLKAMEVKVYGVQAGTIHSATNFYAEIADITEGRHLKLTHFDVITDMFLAVCYREGSEELLEEFHQELERAGRMVEQTKAMFVELKETDEDRKKKRAEKKMLPTASSTPERYVSDEWWDHTLCKKNTKPLYMYDTHEDTWKQYQDPTPIPILDSEPRRRPFPISIRSSGSSKSKKKGRRSCSIM